MAEELAGPNAPLPASDRTGNRRLSAQSTRVCVLAKRRVGVAPGAIAPPVPWTYYQCPGTAKMAVAQRRFPIATRLRTPGLPSLFKFIQDGNLCRA